MRNYPILGKLGRLFSGWGCCDNAMNYLTKERFHSARNRAEQITGCFFDRKLKTKIAFIVCVAQ